MRRGPWRGVFYGGLALASTGVAVGFRGFGGAQTDFWRAPAFPRKLPGIRASRSC